MSDITKREDGWWIVGAWGTEDCGPYDTKAEAESDRVGVDKSFLHVDDKKFWTTEK
jgi:hypothetical protein